MSNLGTVVNTGVVLCSFGLFTWVVMLFYAIRRRSRWLFAAAGGYLFVAASFIFLLELEHPEREPGNLAMVSILAQIGFWGIGAAHTVLLNRAVLAMLRSESPRPARRRGEERRIRREQARYLLYQYPPAREHLRIGRPDLLRSFDDGGLVDINSVSELAIAQLPGLTGEQTRQLSLERRTGGPFASMEDLTSRCPFVAKASDELREIFLFLPPVPAPRSAPER